MPAPPKWYLPVTVVALLWNVLGCLAYLSDVMLSPEAIGRMTAAQQELYAARTVWSVSATAVAVWFGAGGSLGLILRKGWALPMLIVSLVGLVVQDFGLFIVTDAAAKAGPVALVLQACVFLIAIGLVMLARTATKRAWIPKQG